MFFAIKFEIYEQCQDLKKFYTKILLVIKKFHIFAARN